MGRKHLFEKLVPNNFWTFYYRKSIKSFNSELGKKKLKGAVIILMECGNKLYAGISCCSKNDIWNRGFGELIAWRRAQLAANNELVKCGCKGLPSEDVFTIDRAVNDHTDISIEEIKQRRKAMQNLANQIISSITLDTGKAKHQTRVESIETDKGNIPLAVSI